MSSLSEEVENAKRLYREKVHGVPLPLPSPIPSPTRNPGKPTSSATPAPSPAMPAWMNDPGAKMPEVLHYTALLEKTSEEVMAKVAELENALGSVLMPNEYPVPGGDGDDRDAVKVYPWSVDSGPVSCRTQLGQQLEEMVRFTTQIRERVSLLVGRLGV